MKSLDSVLESIERSYDDIVSHMIGMIRIPAIAPVNGGLGESEKADYLATKLTGFDSVERVDVPDELDPSVMRSNILAKKNGKKPGTVWVVSHIDVVPTGDESFWDTPPFDPVLKDGKIYGRGTEDNGQSVISSLFAAYQFPKGELEGMSLGLAFVADEETTSKMGIQYLLDRGCFSEDDIILVPDWGSPNGSMIEISEKSLIWLKFKIHGKTAHGSTPDEGINAYRVSTALLTDLLETFPKEFPDRDEVFMPSVSTFEPTKRIATVENINTIPGYDEFCMDIRVLPHYSVDDVLKVARMVADRHSERTNAKIEVEEVQRHVSGRMSSVETCGFAALSDAVTFVTGSRPKAVGVGGGTCANFFREKGMDAYVWQSGGGTLHAPNEYVPVENIILDSKVFATVFYNLCYKP
ncbi:MAG: M20 family metallo-hydrolase [Candidatus Methanomethylophilaceae archaeon]|nr:M20 family metallo-hydrolase [Candidatus Methanomethylophilaceae archaeon]